MIHKYAGPVLVDITIELGGEAMGAGAGARASATALRRDGSCGGDRGALVGVRPQPTTWRPLTRRAARHDRPAPVCGGDAAVGAHRRVPHGDRPQVRPHGLAAGSPGQSGAPTGPLCCGPVLFGAPCALSACPLDRALLPPSPPQLLQGPRRVRHHQARCAGPQLPKQATPLSLSLFPPSTPQRPCCLRHHQARVPAGLRGHPPAGAHRVFEAHGAALLAAARPLAGGGAGPGPNVIKAGSFRAAQPVDRTLAGAWLGAVPICPVASHPPAVPPPPTSGRVAAPAGAQLPLERARGAADRAQGGAAGAAGGGVPRRRRRADLHRLCGQQGEGARAEGEAAQGRSFRRLIVHAMGAASDGVTSPAPCPALTAAAAAPVPPPSTPGQAPHVGGRP
jgi:hypothetical protein